MRILSSLTCYFVTWSVKGIKPIFQGNWLPNANEMNERNMKCTWPTRDPGVTQILAFLDTNMLVSPTRNSDVGGLDHRKAPMRKFCVAVEYRL